MSTIGVVSTGVSTVVVGPEVDWPVVEGPVDVMDSVAVVNSVVVSSAVDRPVVVTWADVGDTEVA